MLVVRCCQSGVREGPRPFLSSVLSRLARDFDSRELKLLSDFSSTLISILHQPAKVKSPPPVYSFVKMLLSDMSQASDPFSTLPSPKKMLSFVDGHKDPRSLMTTHLEDAKYWI